MKMKKKELLSSLTPFRGMRPHGPPSPFDTLHSSFVLRGKHQEKAIHLLLPESSALPVPSSWSPAFFVLFCYFGVCVEGGVLHHTTCGISVPWLEIKPGPLAMRARRLNRWTTRESPPLVFYVQEQPPWLGPELRNDENLCALFVWNKAWQLTVGMGFPQELWLRFGDPPLGRSNTKQGHQQGPPFNTPCRCVWPGTLSFSLAIAWPSVA